MNRLYRVYKERLKFYILILLVIISLAQLGILWSYQNQGLPFNFLHLFNSKQTVIDYSQPLKSFFSPNKVIISEGFDAPKYILNKNNSNYDLLWEDAKFYINSVFKMKSTKSDINLSEWYTLVEAKGFIFDFKTNIKVNMLKDFLNISEIMPNSPTGVYKMIISPWGDSSEYSKTITIYINDGIKIFKYENISPSVFLKDKDSYEKIITDISSKSDVVYSYLVTLDNSYKGFVSDDTTAVNRGNISFNSLSSSLPFGIGSKGNEDINKIASKILGPEKDNYERSINQNSTIELKTLNNIYRIYSNGFMDYNYTSSQENTVAGDLKDAFKNAFEFVNKLEINSDNKNMTLFLSNYKLVNNSYQFMFDYMISDDKNDFPIYMKYSYKDGKGNTVILNNAIIVNANSKNVVSCKAMLKAFKFTGEYKEYGIGIGDAIYLNSISLLNNNEIEKNISVSYEMDNEEENAELKMVWLIEDGKDYYAYPMLIK